MSCPLRVPHGVPPAACRSWTLIGGIRVSTTLVVEAFAQAPPTWRASVSAWGPLVDRLALRRIALSLIEGVGEFRYHVEEFATHLFLRAPLSSAEAELLARANPGSELQTTRPRAYEL